MLLGEPSARSQGVDYPENSQSVGGRHVKAAPKGTKGLSAAAPTHAQSITSLTGSRGRKIEKT